MGKVLNYLGDKVLDFAESRLFKLIVLSWACIWLVMAPMFKLLHYYILLTKNTNPDSIASFLWGVLFWILGGQL